MARFVVKSIIVILFGSLATLRFASEFTIPGVRITNEATIHCRDGLLVLERKQTEMQSSPKLAQRYRPVTLNVVSFRNAVRGKSTLLPGSRDRLYVTYYWIPLYILLLPLCAITAVIIYRAYLRRIRYSLGLCMSCGYDVRCAQGACPECGTVNRHIFCARFAVSVESPIVLTMALGMTALFVGLRVYSESKPSAWSVGIRNTLVIQHGLIEFTAVSEELDSHLSALMGESYANASANYQAAAQDRAQRDLINAMAGSGKMLPGYTNDKDVLQVWLPLYMPIAFFIAIALYSSHRRLKAKLRSLQMAATS